MIESELNKVELENTLKFYSRLSQNDLRNVEKIITLVDNVANRYFSNDQHKSNYFAFENDEIIGNPFFAVYLIGGYLNKDGERKDIDLLIATNMRWTEGFIEDHKDEEVDEPIWRGIKDQFSKGYKIKKAELLPTDYSIGAVERKVLINIIPKNGKPLDINYVRSWPDELRYKFVNEEQFITLDIGINREQLTKSALYRSSRQLYEQTLSPRTLII